MALPVIPFVVGAAAGAAATYLYKDKEVREDLLHSSLHYLSYLNPWRKKEEEAVESETTESDAVVSEPAKANKTEFAETNTEQPVH